MKKIILLSSLLLLSACAAKQVKILDAAWVSMKHSGPPENPKKLMKVAALEEQYCMSGWSGSFGLMDEAVKQAESKFTIDYIRNASFIQDIGRSCVTVNGEGYRVTP